MVFGSYYRRLVSYLADEVGRLIQTNRRLSSSRAIQLQFVVLIVIVGCIVFAHAFQGNILWIWFLIGASIVVLTLISSSLRTSLVFGWFIIGGLLGILVQPIVTAVLYFSLVTGFGIILKISSILKFRDRAKSDGWQERSQTINAESLKRQY